MVVAREKMEDTDRMINMESGPRMSEEKYRLLFESMTIGVVYQNSEGHITSANPSAERILGLSLDQMQGRTSMDPRWRAIHEDGSDFTGDTHPSMMALKTGENVRNVVMGVFNPSTGNITWININAVPQTRPGEEKPYQVYTLFEDITERKRTEAELRMSEERYRLLFNTANDAVFVHELTEEGVPGKFIEANNIACSKLGYSREELLEMTPFDLNDPEMDDTRRITRGEIALHENNLMFETVKITKDGRRIPFEINGHLFEIDGRSMVLAIARDITERKRAEEALRESEERFKDFFENEPEYCYMVTTDGKIMDVNRSALDMLGYKKKEIIGKPLLTTIYAPKSRDTAKEYFQEWKEKGVMRNKELIIVKKDGAERTVLLSANAVRDSKGEIIHSISVQRDITERKAAEEKVRKMSQAVEQSPALVVITDTLGNIEFVNPKFCQLTGYTAREVMGKNPRILKSGNQSEDFYRDLWDTITDGKEWRGEFHNKKKNGELYWESASISPIIDEKGEATHYIAIKEDVTERKAMEQELKDHADHLKEEVKKQANELIQSEKMAGIGLLVAGVAHEVNNPLAYVKSNSNFLKEDFLKMKEHLVKTGWEGGDLKETEELLDSNIEGLDRIAKITRTLKRFARPDSGGRAFVNINEGIRDTLIMVNNQLKFRIEVHEDYGKIPMLDCNIGQLNQVFMNLMINASQAMEKGDLWIKTWSDDQNIYIRIEDNGKGIAEDRIMNIFDPFYTTKENGTGLGLSISYRIIQEHDGEINVESDRNKGTIMTIRLPLEA